MKVYDERFASLLPLDRGVRDRTLKGDLRAHTHRDSITLDIRMLLFCGWRLS